MLRLTSSNGAVFELSIAGYQFPEIKHDRFDSNWLLIRIHVVHHRGQWTSQDSCLLTWDVVDLAKWFDAIAGDLPVNPEEDFLEQELEFRLIDKQPAGRSVAIYFRGVFRPSWANEDEDPVLFVEFPISDVDLANAAEELRRELAAYPPRGRSGV
jgi:hypothetical protein